MKAVTAWSFKPYRPFLFETGDIYICRVVPEKDSIAFFWLPCDGAREYSVFFGKRGEALSLAGTTKECSFLVENLFPDADYQFQVISGQKKSRVRLARTGEHVGTVVNYLHPEDKCYSFSGQYLCSPSLVRHPDGFLLASMDVFAGNSPQNLALIFRSDDEGKTWRYVTELYPCFWPKMFIHHGMLYVLACSTEYGDLLIGCSEDGGETFSAPQVLLRGSGRTQWPGVHKNPQPLVEKDGRLWNTLEWGCWHDDVFSVMVMSASVNDDLMLPESWHFTPPLPYNPAWPGTASGSSHGNIEGTLAIAPNGKLLNIMRYDMMRCTPNFGTVLAYEVNTDDCDAPLVYSHSIAFPANHSKFEIQYDKVSGYYFSIASRILSSQTPNQRNLLSLLISPDLEHWTVAHDLLDYRTKDPNLIGFQYVDFIIEGDDILFLCRTAMNGAHNFHDANYSTFHRIHQFRQYLYQRKTLIHPKG